jgi:hypothetical protein
MKKKKIKVEVVCVFGKFGKNEDFVLEPTCYEGCKCEVCKDSFWVEGEVKSGAKEKKV